MGIDLGARRIGVAVSDSHGTLASPRTTVERTGDPDADRVALVALVTEEGVARVVVGRPVSLDGRSGPAAKAADAETAALAEALAPLGVAVDSVDERFTTVTAQQGLAAAGRPRHRQRERGRPGRRRRPAPGLVGRPPRGT